jgi:hypothetical protein
MSRQANRWNVQRLRKFQKNTHPIIDQSNDAVVNNANDDEYDDYALPGAYAVSRWYDHQRIIPAANLAIIEQQWDEEDQEPSNDLNANIVLPRRDPLSLRETNALETEEEKENTYATYGIDNDENDIPNQYLESYYFDQNSPRDPNGNKTKHTTKIWNPESICYCYCFDCCCRNNMYNYTTTVGRNE